MSSSEAMREKCISAKLDCEKKNGIWTHKNIMLFVHLYYYWFSFLFFRHDFLACSFFETHMFFRNDDLSAIVICQLPNNLYNTMRKKEENYKRGKKMKNKSAKVIVSKLSSWYTTQNDTTRAFDRIFCRITHFFCFLLCIDQSLQVWQKTNQTWNIYSKLLDAKKKKKLLWCYLY